MKITYFGTGGGAGVPEIFCSCRVCEAARQNRGRDIRTRSQAAINDDLIIDFPVDTFLHTLYGGLDMRKHHHVLITHSHFDHFLHQDLFSRAQGADIPLNIYVTEGSSKQVVQVKEAREAAFASGKRIRTDEMEIKIHIIGYFEPFSLLNYKVTPLRARHAANVDSAIYLIEDTTEGKRLLWAHDTGLLPDDTRDYLVKEGCRLDFVSLDCTLERGNCITVAHMDLERCHATLCWLRECGLADAGTKAVISHIGHLLRRTHAELEVEAAELGFITAYDGMILYI
jgi:phosphoribosyl 1,2-cyclic phosphate phosphodiesterase